MGLLGCNWKLFCLLRGYVRGFKRLGIELWGRGGSLDWKLKIMWNDILVVINKNKEK